MSTELTRREIQIMELANKGLRAKEIGEKLGISTFTVQTHKRNIYEKTDSRSMTEVSDKVARLQLENKYGAEFAETKARLSEALRIINKLQWIVDLFTNPNSRYVKWNAVDQRLPIDNSPVLIHAQKPTLGWYIKGEFVTEAGNIAKPKYWADASLASFESEVAA